MLSPLIFVPVFQLCCTSTPLSTAVVYKVDVELAKEVASQVEGPDAVKRELWLDIAKYLIKDLKDVHGYVLRIGCAAHV